MFCCCLDISVSLRPSTTRFSFENGMDNSLGELDLSMPIRIGCFLSFHADVVSADIRVLGGLDVIRNCGLILDFR